MGNALACTATCHLREHPFFVQAARTAYCHRHVVHALLRAEADACVSAAAHPVSVASHYASAHFPVIPAFG